jgi:N-acetylmuramic acid 6-phosphate (MurNAc-6-P) etherase
MQQTKKVLNVVMALKGVTVRKLLMDMFHAGSFVASTNCMQDLMIPLYLRSEAVKVRSVLELVYLVFPQWMRKQAWQTKTLGC